MREIFSIQGFRLRSQAVKIHGVSRKNSGLQKAFRSFERSLPILFSSLNEHSDISSMNRGMKLFLPPRVLYFFPLNEAICEIEFIALCGKVCFSLCDNVAPFLPPQEKIDNRVQKAAPSKFLSNIF